MKTSITRKEFAQLGRLKVRAGKLWDSMDRLIEKARPLLGDNSDDPNCMTADLILNSSEMSLRAWLKRNKIEVK